MSLSFFLKEDAEKLAEVHWCDGGSSPQAGTDLLSDLGLGHGGAPLFKSGLDWIESSLDLGQLGTQTVDGTASLHRLWHLQEESSVQNRSRIACLARGNFPDWHLAQTRWADSRRQLPASPVAAATAWPPAAAPGSHSAAACPSTSSSAGPWCSEAEPSGCTAACEPPESREGSTVKTTMKKNKKQTQVLHIFYIYFLTDFVRLSPYKARLKKSNLHSSCRFQSLFNPSQRTFLPTFLNNRFPNSQRADGLFFYHFA